MYHNTKGYTNKSKCSERFYAFIRWITRQTAPEGQITLKAELNPLNR